MHTIQTAPLMSFRYMFITHLNMTLVMYYSEWCQIYAKFQVHWSAFLWMSEPGKGRWGTRLLQFLVNHLTLSQSGGQIMLPRLLLAPLDFQTYRHPCLLSRWYIWNPTFIVWQKGIEWLQAVCTCPQKAIVVLQKKLFRWIPCKKSM